MIFTLKSPEYRVLFSSMLFAVGSLGGVVVAAINDYTRRVWQFDQRITNDTDYSLLCALS